MHVCPAVGSEVTEIESIPVSVFPNSFANLKLVLSQHFQPDRPSSEQHTHSAAVSQRLQRGDEDTQSEQINGTVSSQGGGGIMQAPLSCVGRTGRVMDGLQTLDGRPHDHHLITPLRPWGGG